MSKMHTANNTKDQIGKKWDSMWAEQRNLDALTSALLGIVIFHNGFKIKPKIDIELQSQLQSQNMCGI